MEKLKSSIPSTITRMISETTSQNLPSTSSSLLDFFLSLDLFHNVVGELVDRSLCSKNTATALDFKQKGNHSFSNSDYDTATNYYSQALRFAPMRDEDDAHNDLVAMLYVNRATSLHKIGLFVESLRDCDRAVVFAPLNSKAWYRRGKANASLENYDDAIRDLNVAMSMELSPARHSWIKSELELILNQGRRTSSSLNKCNENYTSYLVEPCQGELQCFSTPAKGRGMASASDIPQASLLHTEEPYATIVLKHCRETHCHFCLNELPADTVPCPSCSIPLYCSQKCQVQAGGKISRSNINNIHEISTEVERCITNISLASNSGIAVAESKEWVTEHKHECGGVHWPAIFPSEIILAGRVLVKSLEQRKQSKGSMKQMGRLDLSHNYEAMLLEKKLELHIYSIVLTYCLQHSYGSEFPLTGVSASQLVILFCQIRVNSMAVVHMKSLDSYGSPVLRGRSSPERDMLTCSIEQVRVGQAIYATGSLFNHSCQPNVHAYFISRALFIRATEFVAAGCPLELSYGPQVGQWDRKVRQQFLEDQYSFKCQCIGCSELNLADLVINAFSCARPNCFGAILGSCLENQEGKEGYHVQDVSSPCTVECPLPVDRFQRDDIQKVAHLLIEQKDGALPFNPGCCLNCGSSRDLESSLMTSNKVKSYIQRLRDGIVSREIQTNVLFDALSALDLLRSTMHAYSKDIAQVEDNLAEAFCLMGDFRRAVHHCKASIQILEKLYHPKHIVIGNELVKLASIQQSLGEETDAAGNINRLTSIFSVYYGSHSDRIFPYLDSLKRGVKS